jgi:hypothetical protein
MEGLRIFVKVLFDSGDDHLHFSSYLSYMKMASIAGGTALQAARITDRTRSMFRAILAENGVAGTDDAILEQEMVMFFKLSE